MVFELMKRFSVFVLVTLAGGKGCSWALVLYWRVCGIMGAWEKRIDRQIDGKKFCINLYLDG